jgi:beta-barrel assembly-enhancing protease
MASDPHLGTIYYGRFSDGKTASAYDVDIKLGIKGVEISRQGQGQGHAEIVWPYETLSTAEPLSQFAIDALLNSPASPGASLFAAEGVFARRLAERAPHLTAKAERWRSSRPWIAAAVAVVASVMAVSWFNLSPSHAIAQWLPDSTRAKIGDEAVRSMVGEYKTCSAPAGMAALDTLMAKLSKAAGVNKTFKVTVVDWGMVNAFAVPGERIITTRAILAKAESADEFAGIVAHEMGHGIEMHPETGIVRAVGFSAGLQLMMGGQGGTLANIGLLMAQLSYSRDAEREADNHALAVLKSAAIAPRGFAAFFKRMKAQDGDEEREPSSFDMFRTHPQNNERIAAIEGQPSYPAKPALMDDDWQALKAICKVTTGGSAPTEPESKVDKDKNGSPGDKDPESPPKPIKPKKKDAERRDI